MKNISLEPKRLFIVGSEWLYFNIYIGPQTSDKFLISILNPLSSQLIEENVIDKWFYIRYKDEWGQHLRARFHLFDVKNVSEVIFRFHDLIMPFLENKLISNITINTYKRELERYGINTIEEFETLFFINSKLILKIIELTEDSQENRWLYGMRSIDTFLDLWNFDTDQKKGLLESLKTSFGKEFGIDKEIRKQLSKKYRDNKSKIENLFSDTNEELDNILKVFKVESKPYVDAIFQKIEIKDSDETFLINDLLSSYIHMHCNRLFQSKQRRHEWILYDLLFEYYYSKSARYKNTITMKLVNN
ncbi:thiopeptide-type bacteriocin biosynthesis protein [Flavobacterium pectinovorum]|uniref:Thiopeptide-type bacteriocin biosynthesis domain-containing protein n=1 Tax=Flavobacterium pectinovorum TaxID=29533 RepID=A0A502EVF6_9FLAO|nr:thiopeptide-type bacteriocin biosynthesis protein [Flavobacterium pectinovorum]TPG40749.1 hypothetical protein EAH81_10405 [Flavobacterium pectinovorum]